MEMSTETEEQQSIGLLIVEYLNDDGYLELTIDQIVEMTGSDKRTVEKVLEKVQSFDPPGIAARDLAECLEIQCHFYDMDDPLLLEVIRYHLGDLERRRYAKLTRVLGVSEKQVQSIADTIATLDPKPGRKYAITENEYVTPDVFVEKIDGEYVVRVNDEGTPPIRISKRYRRMLENREDLSEEAYEYIKNKFKSAMWLIRNIEQRKRTLYNVTKQIVQMQHDFLEHGITHLRPMRLRDVADAIGVHEATVCRVVNKKYLQTPRGLFELKYFFSTGLDTGGAEDMSAKSVMEIIRNLIEDEDPKKPLSDQKITEILQRDYELNIARRTVAKYREKMGILSTSKRKRY
ncbi:RNA polymerase factor sigma-54 [bacterium]|nr:RNA polymerase factor sigma-54 [bacterium]